MNDFEQLNDITAPLLYWYQGAARDLPWRRDPTPYHVWISEIMLQQTRVEAVRGYYARFLAAFPTVAALSEADDDQLNKVWQGLGYYSRARNLKRAAVMLMRDFGGELPADHAALLTLPGVGAYTAGAIGSIAFGLPTPAVDGNVLRVVTRLCANGMDITKQATKDRVTAALAAMYPQTPDEAAMMTQALMELGAVVCVPGGAPHCTECPLASTCLAHAEGRETEFPKKPPRRARTVENRTIFMLRHEGRYAIRRRPEMGLLSGLWEFPGVDEEIGADGVSDILARWGITARSVAPIAPAKHIFTHIEWHMTGYLCETQGTSDAFLWETPKEILGRYSVPSAFRAYLRLLDADTADGIASV